MDNSIPQTGFATTTSSLERRRELWFDLHQADDMWEHIYQEK